MRGSGSFHLSVGGVENIAPYPCLAFPCLHSLFAACDACAYFHQGRSSTKERLLSPSGAVGVLPTLLSDLGNHAEKASSQKRSLNSHYVC